jgi:hypothetical protein
LTEIKETTRRQTQGAYTFEEAALRYLEEIVDQGIIQTPTLTVVRRQKEIVGKMSEIKKGLAAV